LLKKSDIIIQSGILCFSLVNDTDTNYNIYFDDFEITHKANPQKLTVSSWAEYYAFGKVAKASCPANGAYRYGYQGEFAEKDQETDWNSFELRQYDSEIGRWLSVDPYQQYWSPYVGMGNDPTNQIDPDGGFDIPEHGGRGSGCGGASPPDMSFLAGMQMDNWMRNVQQTKPWEVNNQWNENYISKYRHYVVTKTLQYETSDAEFWCDDYVLSLIIDFSAENSLPLSIENATGRYNPKTYNGSFSDFKNQVLSTTGARDLSRFNNSIRIPFAFSSGFEIGNFIVSKGMNHVMMFYHKDLNNGYMKQGNADAFGIGDNPAYIPYGGTSVQSAQFNLISGRYQRKRRFWGDYTYLDNIYSWGKAYTWNFYFWNKQ
jgi:RHS repeat-associated protein